MNKENWLEFCLSLGPTFADTPFAKMEKGPATIVVKHLKNKKSFVYISEREGKLVLAVKVYPLSMKNFVNLLTPYARPGT
ncbi:hypothetical protein ACRPK2_07425 [Lactococcus garvieae]|uniref:MmcQ/YjbR family DNA-binding protein n=1 Tax=Lactococcus garvieae TaxID=1363 RepID=A0A1I4HLR6_9LACT|nr:hypothetical protein [Lactococcus garvieae]SFL43125.1 hypothetical protein SAMN05216438_10966 [Lactococcus garvieae]